jgi:hypothetical protein
MLTFDIDISDHRARSLHAELAAQAALLLAIDSGIARVLRFQFAEQAAHIRSLGELSGRHRDIPDPYRMHMGVWVSYAREIAEMLTAAWPELQTLTASQHEPAVAPASAPAAALDEPAETPPLAAAAPADDPRRAAVERCVLLLDMLRDMPDLVDWARAHQQLGADLRVIAGHSLAATDLVQAYTAVLIAALKLRTTPPNTSQCGMLRDAIACLQQPIDQQTLTDLSSRLTELTGAA